MREIERGGEEGAQNELSSSPLPQLHEKIKKMVAPSDRVNEVCVFVCVCEGRGGSEISAGLIVDRKNIFGICDDGL